MVNIQNSRGKIATIADACPPVLCARAKLIIKLESLFFLFLLFILMMMMMYERSRNVTNIYYRLLSMNRDIIIIMTHTSICITTASLKAQSCGLLRASNKSQH